MKWTKSKQDGLNIWTSGDGNAQIVEMYEPTPTVKYYLTTSGVRRGEGMRVKDLTSLYHDLLKYSWV